MFLNFTTDKCDIFKEQKSSYKVIIIYDYLSLCNHCQPTVLVHCHIYYYVKTCNWSCKHDMVLEVAAKIGQILRRNWNTWTHISCHFKKIASVKEPNPKLKWGSQDLPMHSNHLKLTVKLCLLDLSKGNRRKIKTMQLHNVMGRRKG